MEPTRTLRRPRRRVAGMSLIETSCASAIVAIAIGGLTNVAATSASLHRTGVEKTAAVRAIDRQVAAISASNFATLTADWNGRGFAAGIEGKAGAALTPLAGDADGLPGSVQVTAPSGDPDELLQVLVRVSWNSSHGPATVSRRLFLSRLGSGS